MIKVVSSNIHNIQEWREYPKYCSYDVTFPIHNGAGVVCLLCPEPLELLLPNGKVVTLVNEGALPPIVLFEKSTPYDLLYDLDSGGLHYGGGDPLPDQIASFLPTGVGPDTMRAVLNHYVLGNTQTASWQAETKFSSSLLAKLKPKYTWILKNGVVSFPSKEVAPIEEGPKPCEFFTVPKKAKKHTWKDDTKPDPYKHLMKELAEAKAKLEPITTTYHPAGSVFYVNENGYWASKIDTPQETETP